MFDARNMPVLSCFAGLAWPMRGHACSLAPFLLLLLLTRTRVALMPRGPSACTEAGRGRNRKRPATALAGFWAAAFPLQVDTFIVVGELALFIAMVDQWERRHKAGAWAVTLLGLAASVAGNIGHVAGHDLQSRGTAAVPPVAAFAAMWVGLSVLKRVIARADETVPSDDEFAAQSVARVPLTVVPDVVSSPLPSDAETAAAAALRATLAAGNPLSMNQLQSRFRLTRKEATEVRGLVLSEPTGTCT